MKIVYDISMNIEPNMQVYKNRDEKKPTIGNFVNFDTASVYESFVNMNLHTGTHIDAPLHVLKDGKKVESYPLDKFISKCIVLDLSDVDDAITLDHIKDAKIEEDMFVVFKTKNSFTEDFLMEFVYLNKEAAKWLADKKISGVGTDGLGIERAQEGHPTHKTLLSNGIMILEGLRLKEVEAGEYTLICLPLKLDNYEAAPARAVLAR